MVGELALPDLHALRVAIAGMIDAEAVAKDSTKALHHLHRKGNLGQEVEHLAALVEGALNEVDIDLGLAARCDAVKKRDILRHLLNEDLVVGVGLGLAEGLDVLGMGHSAEGDAAYFLLVQPQDPTVQKLAEDGGGAVGLVHQFLAGDLALGHGILFADAGQLQIGAEDLLLGRSALDAVELMNVGVQFLREHMPQSARIHYAITDAGGNSPNVVQPHAQVLYMVRSVLAKDALALQERVDKIAQGAAMMTETKLSKRFIDGCSNTVPNKTLETLFWKNFNEVGVPTHTPEEVEFAKKMIASYEMTKNKLPGDACDEDAEIAEWVDKASEHGTVPLNDFLVPYHFSTKERPGSTDVGDVSWLVPTAQINVVTFPSNSPGHSWQNVSCGHTSIGHKGLLTAGKVIAATAIDLYENPQIIADAKAEFDKRAAGGYYCPVPEDAVPTVVGGQF